MYSFSTPALGGGGWSKPRPCRFTPGKTRYPMYRRLGGPQDRSGRVRKISPPPGFFLLCKAIYRIRSPNLPARSQSLYRLSYQAHKKPIHENKISKTYFRSSARTFMTCFLVVFATGVCRYVWIGDGDSKAFSVHAQCLITAALCQILNWL
jgi:hypothetical protein